MPPYINPGQGSPQLLIPGLPSYSAGSLNRNQPLGRMIVTKSAVSSNVVTLTVTMVEGNIPSVGDTAFISGTQNDSGNLNIPGGVALSAVSITAATGIGTIQYSATASNLSTTVDQGTVLVRPSEVGDSLTSNTPYLQVVMQQPSGFSSSGRTVTWSTVISGSPSGVTVNLEGSLVDIDNQYSTLDSSTNTSGETRFITGVDMPFLRIKTGTITGGTSPKLIGKILI